MKTTRVFDEKSVTRFFWDFRKWVSNNPLFIKLFYIGSFVYDINGNPYATNTRLSDWTIGDNTLTDEEKSSRSKIQEIFNASKFRNSLNITQIIQQHYFKKLYQNKTIHLSISNQQKTIGFIEETVINEDKFNLKDLADLIAEDKQENKDDIVLSFNSNFDVISNVNAHIYFIPTSLKSDRTSVIFNVATLISPELFSDNTLSYIKGGLMYCSNSMIQDTFLYLSDLIIRESIKSAKAAIMSRNLSHNLGSHVMFYIKQKLDSVSSIFKEGTLEELIQAKSITELKEQLSQQKLDNEMPFLVGLGRFLNYLQERQDYIATVATDYIPYRTTINFKDAIFDELKPEKRYERHKNDPNAKDRKAANLLLNFIAYSEGLTSSNKIVLKFRKDGINNNVYANNDDYFDGSGKPMNVPVGLRDFNVSLPGGNLGRQAFFSIIENIIRNTAKHESNFINKDKKLTFLFDKLDVKNISHILGYSWRDGESCKQNEKDNIINTYKNYYNYLYYLGITVKLKKSEKEIDNTITKIRDGLRQDYLTPDRQMDENCKGLKEVRISAAWLRNEKMDDEISIKEPPAIAIRKTNEGYLQYIICLPKPKIIAFISNNNVNDSHLDEYGCQLFDMNHFEEMKKQISDFDMIVCTDNDFCKIRPFVGTRVLKNNIFIEDYQTIREQYNTWKNQLSQIEQKIETGSNDKDIEQLNQKYSELKEKDPQKPLKPFIGKLYKTWLEQVFIKDKEVKLSILDEKVPDSTKNSIDTDISAYVKNGSSDDAEVHFFSNTIVFNTHYKGQAKAKNKKLFAKAHFVEGISGGNSTDRLIRREIRDIPWYCRHKVAGLAQIAIFDERLYGLIMPSEGYELIQIKSIEDKLFSNEATNLKLLMDNSTKVLNLNTKECSELYKSLKNKTEEKLKDNQSIKKEEYRSCLPKEIRDYSRTWQYREKGIWVFNIRINPKSSEIEIVGYNAGPTRGEIGIYNEDYCEKVIAHIRIINNRIKVDWSDNYKDSFNNKFDFISIHQGLLDKIYDALNIPENGLEKASVTDTIYDAFSFKALEEKSGDEHGFLPQFIIHSGRSKPNEKDMPQHLPFLQFSAIEHAVRDCKYSLTELLYSAHYEQ